MYIIFRNVLYFSVVKSVLFVFLLGAVGYNVGGGQVGMYMNFNGGDNYQSSDNSVGDNV